MKKYAQIMLVLMLVGTITGISTAAQGGATPYEKAQAIKIENVDFEDATVQQIVAWLRRVTKKSDPAGTGINFFLKFKEPEKVAAIKITIDAISLPVADFLRYVCIDADLYFFYDKNAIIISDFDLVQSEDMELRAYTLKPGFTFPAKQE